MRVQLDSDLIEKVKKLDGRIRKQFRTQLELFRQNPNNSHLKNHPLDREYFGYCSINITNDYRAIYERLDEDPQNPIAYFFDIGTHEELYNRVIAKDD